MGWTARRAGLAPRLGLAAIFVSTLGLAGCSDLDNSLFPPGPGDTTATPAKPASTSDTSSSDTSAANNSASTSSESTTAAPPTAAQPAPQPDSSQQEATNEQPNSEQSSSDQSWVDRLFGSDESDQRPAGQSGQSTTQEDAQASNEPQPDSAAGGDASSPTGSWLDSLFGDDESEQSQPRPQSSEPSGENAPEAGNYAPPGGGVNISPRESKVHPIAIESGPDTGTTVNKTVQSLRGQVSDMEQKMLASAAQTKDLRDALARESSSYVSAVSGIVPRLQLGTTRANPELVAQWNSAQTALDKLASDINSLATLGTGLSSDVSNARQLAGQIQSTYEVPGAVDEDHRQLGVLTDEQNNIYSTTDRIFRAVSNEVRRQTGFVATERRTLAGLENSIKSGDPYAGSTVRGPALAGNGSNQYFVASESGKPFIVIRFDRPDVAYQQILLAALKEALKTRPNANFKVVGIAPPAHSARAVSVAQSTARRRAQDVLQTMAGMGVPAGRLHVAAMTDPSASATEVRIFII